MTNLNNTDCPHCKSSNLETDDDGLIIEHYVLGSSHVICRRPMTKPKMTRDDAMTVLASNGLATREDAITKYGDLVAAKWGESERAAGVALVARNSYGLIVNAVIYFDPDATPLAELSAAGKAILTAADVKALRKGG